MKKTLMVMVLFAFPAMALTGCGDSGIKTVESAQESDSSMSASQEDEYKKQMEAYSKTGGGGSSRPGN